MIEALETSTEADESRPTDTARAARKPRLEDLLRASPHIDLLEVLEEEKYGTGWVPKHVHPE
ncbi:hypothetical protein [Candidatus Poriferisocius sp.]|uniref:hypothetical protein n=1 Tax=Candidatus Poriferisocius sp. TaxID=3101276 RepID=UPI003B02DFBF